MDMKTTQTSSRHRCENKAGQLRIMDKSIIAGSRNSKRTSKSFVSNTIMHPQRLETSPNIGKLRCKSSGDVKHGNVMTAADVNGVLQLKLSQKRLRKHETLGFRTTSNSEGEFGEQHKQVTSSPIEAGNLIRFQQRQTIESMFVEKCKPDYALLSSTRKKPFSKTRAARTRHRPKLRRREMDGSNSHIAHAANTKTVCIKNQKVKVYSKSSYVLKERRRKKARHKRKIRPRNHGRAEKAARHKGCLKSACCNHVGDAASPSSIPAYGSGEWDWNDNMEEIAQLKGDDDIENTSVPFTVIYLPSIPNLDDTVNESDLSFSQLALHTYDVEPFEP